MERKEKSIKSTREIETWFLCVTHLFFFFAFKHWWKNRIQESVWVSILSLHFYYFTSTCLVAHVSRRVVRLKRLCKIYLVFGTRAEERKTHVRHCCFFFFSRISCCSSACLYFILLAWHTWRLTWLLQFFTHLNCNFIYIAVLGFIFIL